MKQIYEGLLAGTLSKREALLGIRSLKAPASARDPLCLLAPVWQEMDQPAASDFVPLGEHVVVLCGGDSGTADELAVLLPQARLEQWPGLAQDGGLAFADLAARCFGLIRSCLDQGGIAPVLLQVVVDEGFGEGLAPLLKSAALESQRFFGQVILTRPKGGAALARMLREEAGSAETLIRHRKGHRRQVQRWRKIDADGAEPWVTFRDNGVYLITGGLGYLGRLIAGEILRVTAYARVVLTGRAPLSATIAAQLADVGGERLEYRQMTLEEYAPVARVVTAALEAHGRLDGVLHAAGTTADNFILRKTQSEFAAVLAPKVIGTVHLDRATRDVDLDFFVLFSSLAAAAGNVGQADYAAANGFLDAFAARRQDRVAEVGRGGRSLAIDWSLWRDGGMKIDAASLNAIVDRTGIAPIDNRDGLRAFHQLLRLDGSRYLAGIGDAAEAARRLNDERQTAPVAPPVRSADPQAADLEPAVERFLVGKLASLLKLGPHRLDPVALLDQYGIDSILAMSLTAELEKSFGKLPKTLFFEHQNIRQLARYFVQAHATAAAALADTDGRPVSAAAPPVRSRTARDHRFAAPLKASPPPRQSAQQIALQSGPVAAREPIAIIGLSGRYPQSADLDSFWRNLREGHDCISEVPPERWDWRDYYSEDRTAEGCHYSKWGGFIPGVDEFDPLFFNISPRDAHNIDPQERLFLQHAWMAVEDAGYARAALTSLRDEPGRGEVGVYVGVMYNEYQMFGVEESLRGHRMALNGSVAAIANRVSFFLDLHGPSMTLDTMCSSSLTAIHLACQDLHLGRTGMAIAGGVNVTVHPNKYLLLSSGQFISSAGQCQSFGEGGNGYVPGEGVGAVVLKRLSDAVADSDHIYAVIRGSGLSHGGRTNGFSVPNPRGQANAIRRALDDAGIEPARIGYIEAHGTGTKLGDPIEVATLVSVFEGQDIAPGACPIGSVKSNIGHCESAAGMAALTKVVLQMRHGEIVPSLHSARLNPYIDFAASPFTVNQTLRRWDRQVADGRDLPRIAGISSFGAGGSNAHLIVEEYAAPLETASASGQEVAILLSARTEEQLRHKARDLLDHVRALGANIDLPAIACTLQLGRDAMSARLALLATSGEELAARLQSWLEGVGEGTASGHARSDREALSMFGSDGDLRAVLEGWLAARKLGKLIELWVRGIDLDWRGLYAGALPRRASLPSYPFARDRYWVEFQRDGEAAQPELHPLVHRNSSTLAQQGYASRFRGDEIFFADRDGARVLSEIAQVAIAAAALRLAQPELSGGIVELHALRWGEAYVVAPRGEIALALTPDGARIGMELYSSQGGEESVHCQGQASVAPRVTEPRVDLAALRSRMQLETSEPTGSTGAAALSAVRRSDGQLLTEISLAEGRARDPALLDLEVMLAALDGAARLAGAVAKPAVASLHLARLAGRCDAESLIWVRRLGDAGEPHFDVDILGRQGEMQVQFRSLRLAVEPVSRQTVASPPPRREIPLSAITAPAAQLQSPRYKPSGIALVTPAAPGRSPAGLRRPEPIRLTAPGAKATAMSIDGVRLYDEGDGILSVRIGDAEAEPPAGAAVAASLLGALATAACLPEAKVLVLHGAAGGFLQGLSMGADAADVRALAEAALALPFPVIAALRGDAVDAGFLLAALCDFLVCSEQGRYGLTDVANQGQGLPALLGERFGPVLAGRLLFPAAASGNELRRFGLAAPVVPAGEVDNRASGLAAVLAGHGREALGLLKAHFARHLTTGLAAWRSEAALPASPASIVPLPLPAATPGLALTHAGENVVIATLAAAEDVDGSIGTLAGLAELVACLEAMQQGVALVVNAAGADFLVGAENEEAVTLLALLRRVTLESSLPVVWALPGDASDLAWIVALLADHCVYGANSRYKIAIDRLAPEAAQLALHAFSCRFGDCVGRELALTGGPFAAAELQRRTGVTVAAPDAVLTEAVARAAILARLPRGVAQRWKRESVAFLTAAPPLDLAWSSGAEPEPLLTVGRIALRSTVVSAELESDGVVLVRMEDRHARNMFSPELVAGVEEAFEKIAALPAAKAVVLTGYGSHFSSGGTLDGLLAIQQGKARFTDVDLFSAPLRCPLPVIAAVQGHGTGAGWSLGMFADFTLLAAEGRYLSPYMDYGFTPGAGSTLIFPARIGYDLARETLMLAQPCSGEDLRQRGIALSVIARNDVLPEARALAHHLARLPRSLLLSAKALGAAPLRRALTDTLRREVAMHERTFVGQAGTLQRIRERFATVTSEDAGASANQLPARTPAASAAGSVGPTELRSLLASELQMSESEFGEDTQFVDLGLDSISGVTFVRKINARFGTTIEATQIYSHPTLRRLAGHIAEEMSRLGIAAAAAPPMSVVQPAPPMSVVQPAPPTAIAQPAAPVAPARVALPQVSAGLRRPAALRSRRGAGRRGLGAGASPEPVAVIGMVGQFPQAGTLEAFWRNIAAGRDCIGEVPRDRWDVDAYYQPGQPAPGKTNSRWLGALEDYDRFDPLFFAISPAEAESMDPQQRLFLQACWNVIEHAGYDAGSLAGSKCGVFVGCATSDYHLASASSRLSAQGFTGAASSILAARISYFLDLQGPSLAIDTACSSSLVAIAQACDSLQSGASSMALAGGVYVMAGPEMHIKTAQAGMLSTDGRCFTFDQRANGFVPGEAVAVVMLKRLSDAERDGDSIYGVIRGWGVNQDGKTNGITAPNPQAQTRLQREVYERFGIDPRQIRLIEAHGTGTKLGDPIEVQALRAAFGESARPDSCALGSVKSNIGHCLTAAGIAGFLKLVLALHHRQLPPTIHFERLNEHISLSGSPFYVNDRLRPWPADAPPGSRLAAINAFGFSGTNAHVVVGDYAQVGLPAPAGLREAGRTIVPLSAKTAEQLHQRAADLLAILQHAPAPEFAELAYTLQTGRQPMEERAAFMANSNTELTSMLEAYIQTGDSVVAAASSVVAVAADAVNRNDQERLAALWSAGAAVDWSALHAVHHRPRRIGLPTYPFARERYRLDTDQSVAAVVTADPGPAVAPPPVSGLLLLAEEWQVAARASSGGISGERIVVLCGELAPGLANLLPQMRLERWPALVAVEDYAERAARCFTLVRDCLTQPGDQPVLLQIVVSEREGILSGLSGLLKTAGLESPRFAGQIVQVEVGIAAAELAQLLQAEAEVTPEPQVRHAAGRRSMRRWRRLGLQADAALCFRDNGVYLITGGLGGLGLLFAGEILRQGSRSRIILTGRSPLSADRAQKLGRLDRDRVEYREMALDDGASVAAAIAAVTAAHGRLDGVLHAAGMIADNFIVRKSAAEFAAVMSSKIAGTVHLDRATAGLDLDFFVLFSSVAAALGNVGQADYAAANGFLDAYAEIRQARVAASGRGGRTVSIDWSLWREGGMQVEAVALAALADTAGLEPIDTAAGFLAFQHSLASGCSRTLAVQGDIDRLWTALAPVAPPPTEAHTDLSPDKAQLTVRTLVRMKELFGSVLKLAPARIDETRQFSAYGIDSLLVTGLNAAFAKIFGAVSKTVVFEHTTLASLTAYFVERYAPQCVAWTGAPLASLKLVAKPAAPKPALHARIVSDPNRPIAIIGLSGSYPQAAGLDQFWDNLRHGRDCVSEIPPQRWAIDGFYEPDVMRAVELGRSYCKWGGFVDQFDEFDPLFFGMSPREAMSIDPQERMFLQTAWHALEDAGYTRADLRERFGRRVGVFAGITKQGFNLHGSEASRRDRKFYPHTSFGSLANRLSYFLDITGPSLPIDTMCSSSLTAIHEACEHIRHGACDMAFAGGVNLYLHRSTYVDMAAQYALSPNGRCHSFGAGADGFVPGEGVGVVLLRPLDAAIADGDPIHGVILATHVNHGGKTNGYTVPNPRAQAELIAETIAKAGLDARSISYIEAHGTGTELGDPIEIEGLKQAFAQGAHQAGVCSIGSAKSNIGHLEAAAGMAGLTKILLQMKHGEIAPSLHAEDLNPAIDFAGSPFVVCRKLTPWHPVDDGGRPVPRVAGISAFGAGGANAHVLLGEHVARARPAESKPFPAIVPISAKTPQQLQDVAASMLRFLDRQDPSLRLDDLAYSLQIGREAMEERAAFVVASVDELAKALRGFLAGTEVAAHRGQAHADLGQDDGMRLAVASWIADGKLDRLAQFWVSGLQFDWRGMYGAPPPRRIGLPGYPFARERYWIGPDQEAAVQRVQVRSEQRFSEAIGAIVAMVDDDRMDIDRAVDMLNALA